MNDIVKQLKGEAIKAYLLAIIWHAWNLLGMGRLTIRAKMGDASIYVSVIPIKELKHVPTRRNQPRVRNGGAGVQSDRVGHQQSARGKAPVPQTPPSVTPGTSPTPSSHRTDEVEGVGSGLPTVRGTSVAQPPCSPEIMSEMLRDLVPDEGTIELEQSLMTSEGDEEHYDTIQD